MTVTVLLATSLTSRSPSKEGLLSVQWCNVTPLFMLLVYKHMGKPMIGLIVFLQIGENVLTHTVTVN